MDSITNTAHTGSASRVGYGLRDLSIRVLHPAFPGGLLLDAVKGHEVTLLADTLEGTVTDASFRFVFSTRRDAELGLSVGTIDQTVEGITVHAIFAGDDDAEAFWQNLHGRDTDAQPDDSAWPRMPMRAQFTEQARAGRVRFLEQHIGIDLTAVSTNALDAEDMKRTTESFIGSVEVPVGAAGPLLFNGQHVSGHLFAPMATTEGSLVASSTRGATAVTASGGVTTAVLDRRITRVPLIQMANLQDAIFVGRWVQSHFDDIRTQTRLMSRHVNLKDLQPQVLGRDLHLHFVYDSADAAGQNMTTGATWRACHWIMERIQSTLGLKVQKFIIESNLSNDKKVSFNNFMMGRGHRAVAECTLSAEVTQRFLHVTPTQLVEGYHSLAAGGVAGGMVGVNINVANMIAAIFTATGQDIASVHESGVGHLSMQLLNSGDAVYASLVLPSLLLGTVGGGTTLPQQRNCLQMLDCVGAGKAPRLAEIICGFALALDLSTLSALVADEFAAAHHPLVKDATRTEKSAQHPAVTLDA